MALPLLVLKYWKVGLSAIAGIGLAIAGYKVGYSFAQSDLVDDYQSKIQTLEDEKKAWLEDKKKFEDTEAAYMVRLADLQKNYQDLLVVLPKLRLLTNEKTKPDSEGNCTESRLSPDFRVCFGAAVRGDRQAVAACQAAGLLNNVPFPREALRTP